MSLDKRLHAYRPDLADERLKGRVSAERFVTGEVKRIATAIVPVMREPRRDAMQLTQALYGEAIRVYDEQDGWLWVQLEQDDYVGYIEAATATSWEEATHIITVPLTHSYPEASIKSQPTQPLTLNARLVAAPHDEKFLKLETGRYVYAAHAAPLASTQQDYVAVAEQFLAVPYLWGGKSFQGIDCSGLVQLSMQACGLSCPRDSDMQEQGLGQKISGNSLKRGDLIFWKGHVGIMTDAETLLHANGHHMQVVKEPLATAVERISATGSDMTSMKRLG